MKEKIIIIGAGPAGLTAAYQVLTTTNYIPVIVESSQSIGGISKTITYHGNRLDMGGHRFFSKSSEVCKLWDTILRPQGQPSKDDLLLKRYVPLTADGPDPQIDDKVMLTRHRVSRIFYLRKFFDYPITIKPATFIHMGFVRTMKAGFGYLAARIHKRKENSLEDFYINRFGKPLYEMFFENYTEKLWGIHPSKISPDWGAQRVKGLSIGKALGNAICSPFRRKKTQIETSLINQFQYPKLGPGQLWETMAAKIIEMGGEIHRGETVVKVTSSQNQISSLTTVDQLGSEKQYEGTYYLSSMAIKDLFFAMDNVPKDVYSIGVSLPYRDFMTVGLLVKKLKIKNKTNISSVNNIVPDCWIYIQERDVHIGRLQIFNNWSPYMVNDFENSVWIGLEYFCSEGDSLWEMSDADFIQLATDELVKINIIDKEDVLDSTRVRVPKAYPAYFGSYRSFSQVQEYLNSFNNLYCIGRNGQHRYNNMDHSMLTAIEAVRSIQEGKHSTESVWNVNTEETYQEEKKN